MEQQFIEIFNLYKNDVLRLAFSYTKNMADAEDITQTVFIKLYNNFQNFENKSHIKKWCIKVTINTCKDFLLSAWKRKIRFFAEREENNIAFEEQNQDSFVITTLMSLPKKYRLVIHLFYYENYKIDEISEILKIKKSTVLVQLSRARLILKEKLKEVWNDEKEQ